MSDTWDFDRHLRYDDLCAWLDGMAAAHPSLVAVERYGTSHEGRPLVLVTVTDTTTGAADTKPAHWVDGSIHATELAATVGACHLIHRLVDGHRNADPVIARALATRTFYVVPRVNPDGAERVLADAPQFLRSSTRAWPRAGGDPLPGLRVEDIDGDGRILQMRIEDPNGAWMPHPEDARVLVPVPSHGVAAGVATYRLFLEGRVLDHDGWTIPTPRPMEGLDLNRTFPAGWSHEVTGAGDHPLAEPETDALVRAIAARKNICGAHAFHTAAGVVLRPPSTRPDSSLEPFDLWAYDRFAARVAHHTGYPVHAVWEDYVWDKREIVGGAADDWQFDHLGVFSWTTEFWDVVLAATGTKQSTKYWYIGASADELLAVLRWVDDVWPDGFVDWRPFDHPELGAVEIGGWDTIDVWTNPPPPLLRDEVRGHADVVVDQALAAPCIEIGHVAYRELGTDEAGTTSWRLEVGVANTGWLPTDVTAHARKHSLVLAGEVIVDGDDVTVVGGPRRVEFGQLDGKSSAIFRAQHDGTPDRALVSFTLRAPRDAAVEIVARHQRAGTDRTTIQLD